MKSTPYWASPRRCRRASASAPCPASSRDRRPDLARLCEPNPDFGTGLWLLTHPDLRASPRMRAFLDCCGGELVRARGLIEGQRPGGCRGPEPHRSRPPPSAHLAGEDRAGDLLDFLEGDAPGHLRRAWPEVKLRSPSRRHASLRTTSRALHRIDAGEGQRARQDEGRNACRQVHAPARQGRTPRLPLAFHRIAIGSREVDAPAHVQRLEACHDRRILVRPVPGADRSPRSGRHLGVRPPGASSQVGLDRRHRRAAAGLRRSSRSARVVMATAASVCGGRPHDDACPALARWPMASP